MTLEERLAVLEAKYERLESVRAIEHLMGKYLYWLYTQKFDKIVEYCWSKHAEDVTVEASDSGLFKGQAQVRRFYAPDGVVGTMGSVRGGFTLHMACAPTIEVAGDGKTAKSVWFSPGCAGDKWIWGTYIVDFIKEEGDWKLWHLNFSPMFRTKYHKGWMEEPVGGSLSSPLQDAPPTRWNPYDKNKMGQELFHHLPDAPMPYETYEE